MNEQSNKPSPPRSAAGNPIEVPGASHPVTQARLAAEAHPDPIEKKPGEAEHESFFKKTHKGVGEGDAGLPDALRPFAELEPLPVETANFREDVKKAMSPMDKILEYERKLAVEREKARVEDLLANAPKFDPPNCPIDLQPVTKEDLEASPDVMGQGSAEFAREYGLAFPDEPADDAPDAPIDPKPGGGWNDGAATDEDLQKLDGFLTGFLSPINLGLGQLDAEDIDGMIFTEFFNRVAASAHLDMVENGFWEDPLAAEARDAVARLDTLKATLAATGEHLNASNEIVALLERTGAIAAKVAERPPRNDLADLMLMVTELAEAAEGERKNPGCPDDKIPEFTMLEAELADVILRIMDFAGGRGLRVAEALVEKKAFNRTRPFKHGKTC